MELKNVGLSFRGKYKIDGGQHFYGQILQPPDTSRVSNFLSARRYLRVHNGSAVAAGMVVIVDNKKYLLGDHASGFFRDKIYTHYKMFQVDQERTWFSKSGITTNAVTGVKEASDPTDNGVVALSVQPKSMIEDGFQIQTPQHTVLVGQPVMPNDKLGDDWVVTRVDPQLGIYVVEVKEG